MKLGIKILQSLIDKLKNNKRICVGRLYGTVHQECQYVLGLFKKDEDTTGDLHFPSDIDMCGVFQTGPLDRDGVQDLLNDVDVTDNPVYISVPDVGVINVYHIINNKLELAPKMRIIQDTDIYQDFLHVRIRGQIPFRSELTNESMKEELLGIRKQMSSGKIAFHCQNHELFLLGSSESMVCGNSVNDNSMSVGKLYESENLKETNYSQNAVENNVLDILSVVLYKKAVMDKNEEEGGHAPVIEIQKSNMQILQILLNIDALSLVHRETKLTELYSILIEGACRNLRLIGKFLIGFVEQIENLNPGDLNPEVLHFYPPKTGHFISRIYSKSQQETDEILRRSLHENFLLHTHRPVFKKSNRYVFKEEQLIHSASIRLKSPHTSAKPSSNGGEQVLVTGDYEYYHYCQDKMDDDGWGCAYRSLQTLASWFILQGYSDRAVPTFKEIQQCLYDIGDKPKKFVGSREWIGSTEVNYVLDTLLEISCKILYASSGEELGSKGPELVYHFKNHGTPVMIGGGVLAHTILGVDYNRDTGNLMFLILDPHYTGGEDIKTIINKGWCAWKGVNFWDKKSYYNMCLPLIPKGV